MNEDRKIIIILCDDFRVIKINFSSFNPIFHWLDAYPATQWLTHFFLPHMVLPPTLLLKIIRISGSVLFVVGCTAFVICALQVYLGKIFKWGIANHGIYRFVRHPQYTSLAIWEVGMAILWPRFIVLTTLSIMFVLYYFLARDEEKRMITRYGDAYKKYIQKTGMFFPTIRVRKSTVSSAMPRFAIKPMFAVPVTVAVIIGTGFVCRYLTLNSLILHSDDNVTLVSIMPEDNIIQTAILKTMHSGSVDFIQRDKDYLGYEMPVDYIMQGMIANTGAEHHLFKQHHTIGLISDWVLHPFDHLRRSPSAHMAKIKNVDPEMARRHHCPLGIDDPGMDCHRYAYRRVIFVEVDHPSNKHISGKELFAFNTKKIPVGFIDLNTRTGDIINEQRVAAKTAWSDVPTPAL